MKTENGDCKPSTNPVMTVVAEAYQRPESTLPKADVKQLVSAFLGAQRENWPAISKAGPSLTHQHHQRYGPDFGAGNNDMSEHIEAIDVFRTVAPSTGEIISDNTSIYVVSLDDQGTHMDGAIDMDGEEIQAANQMVLPSKELHGVWDHLIYGDDVKEKLLRYVFTAMKLSDSGVDPNLISWNRLVLLHGPPGTGKTSLCRALAQKLSVRLSDRFEYGYLVEVNSHSLFSKWFSESGKLVQKMFSHVQELIDDPVAFVCVLIDEVESLAAARKASSSEPSDAIRVVNAVLTQIDTIKNYNNVLIMTTSNITGTIDLAFVDRADIKQYIGPPGPEACYGMLSGSLKELIAKGLVTTDEVILPSSLLSKMRLTSSQDEAAGDMLPSSDLSWKLWAEAERTQGLSGRTLRKLPFLALTDFNRFPVSGSDFLASLHDAVTQAKENKEEHRLAQS